MFALFLIISSLQQCTAPGGVPVHQIMLGLLPIGLETERSNRWNLLDYGEVVVHIMHPVERENYKIEKFWSHAMMLEREIWEENSKEIAMYS